jgi:hypothetical protein
VVSLAAPSSRSVLRLTANRGATHSEMTLCSMLDVPAVVVLSSVRPGLKIESTSAQWSSDRAGSDTVQKFAPAREPYKAAT